MSSGSIAGRASRDVGTELKWRPSEEDREKAVQPETTGQTLMDGAGVGEPQQGPSARAPPPPQSCGEHLAHINSLIVETHSRHNDSLFVDEGIVDLEGSRAASWPSLGPVCCGSEAGSTSRQTGKTWRERGSEPRIPYPGQSFKWEDMEGLDSDFTDRHRERKWREVRGGGDLGHISVWLSLRGCQ